jgi:SAM-dependent methyltransferase
MSDKIQARYFENVDYRGPTHPVVAAYVQPKLDYIASTIGLRRDWTVLDVGCGNGIFTHHLAKLCPSVVGLDYSANLLKGNPEKVLIRGDATTLPFPDESFDVVFEANILHHIGDRLAVVAEMARVARKYVVLLEPNRYNPVMLGLSLVVSEERGGLRSSVTRLQSEILECGLQPVSNLTTGMISQNNTPAFLIPLLKRFDRQIWWGEYIVTIARKDSVASAAAPALSQGGARY